MSANTTRVDNELWVTEISSIEAILFGCAMCIVVVLTLVGNSLVCIVFWRFRNLRNLTNYFVCSLAVADLLVPLLRVLYIVVTIFSGRWVFGSTWCEMSSMCGVLLCGASILHLCAISIERLIAIKWPLSYDVRVTPRRVVTALSYIWIQSAALALIPALPVNLAKQRFNPHMAECEIDWLQDPVLTILVLFFYFFIPVNIMVVTYALIFREVQRNTRRVKAIHVGSTPAVSSFKRDLKAVKTLAVVIGVFFIMWMPYFVTTTIRAFRGEQFIPPWLQRVCITLSYGNSGCNVVIYALMNLQYRGALLRLLKDCRERRLFLGGDLPLNAVNPSTADTIHNNKFSPSLSPREHRL